MNMRTIFKNKLFKVLIGVLVAIVLLVVIVMELVGGFELMHFNSGSITDWRLGGTIEGVSSPHDGITADIRGFDWFEDDGEMGFQSSGGTRYYMDYYPSDGIGGFRIVGFFSAEKVYSVLSIRVGDDLSDATMQLLDKGYSMQSGGLNKCSAINGHVTVTLYFEHGVVTQIEARLK